MASSCRIYCSVYGCLNSSLTKPEISFFRLPTQSEKLSTWLRLICRDDLANKSNVSGYRICEEHFNVQDILPKSNRKLLKMNALPSLKLPDPQITVPQESKKVDKQTQTEKAVQESHVKTTANLSCSTPRKRKLKSELNESRKKLKVHEPLSDKAEQRIFHKLCDKFLTKDLALLVKAQTYLNSCKRKQI